MWRVTTLLTGDIVRGGGISRLYFDSATFTAGNANTAVVNFWNALRSVIADNITISVQAIVDNVNPATGQITSQTNTSTTNAAGLDTGDPLPPAVQGLLRVRTGVYVAGREVRGRVFIPGPTELSSTNGVPTTAYQSAVTLAGNNLIADPNSGWEVWSRKNGTEPVVATAGAWTEWASLRSRRNA